MRRLTVSCTRLRSRVALAPLLLATAPARAEPVPDAAPSAEPPPPAAVARTPRAEIAYPHLFGALSLGRGLRFNNPYRLATQLGDSGESLSLSATYLDVAFGITSARYGRLEHGGVAHLSVAMSGIPQEVLSFSYIAQRRFLPSLIVHARGGVPIVIEPDVNAGLELAGGTTWLLRSGLGLTAELVGSIFYGAATLERSVSVIPLLSLQVGVAVDYEVLP